jgi:hypothetical protein
MELDLGSQTCPSKFIAVTFLCLITEEQEEFYIKHTNK